MGVFPNHSGHVRVLLPTSEEFERVFIRFGQGFYEIFNFGLVEIGKKALSVVNWKKRPCPARAIVETLHRHQPQHLDGALGFLDLHHQLVVHGVLSPAGIARHVEKVAPLPSSFKTENSVFLSVMHIMFARLF
jgi:hypothetical protein